MNIENLEFVEALKFLADRAGSPFPSLRTLENGTGQEAQKYLS